MANSFMKWGLGYTTTVPEKINLETHCLLGHFNNPNRQQHSLRSSVSLASSGGRNVGGRRSTPLGSGEDQRVVAGHSLPCPPPPSRFPLADGPRDPRFGPGVLRAPQGQSWDHYHHYYQPNQGKKLSICALTGLELIIPCTARSLMPVLPFNSFKLRI